MSKLLLAMLYWPGDQTMAEETLRLIADLEPEHSKTAGVMFVARFDATINQAAIADVSRKFDVFTHKTRRREVGFPGGCNGMAFDTIFWLAEKKIEGALVDYDAVLILEPDCLPLCPDWIWKLRCAWEACRPAAQMGHVFRWDGNDPWTLHCNAASLLALRPDVFDFFIRLGGCDPMMGWDWAVYQRLKSLGVFDSSTIRFAWRQQNMPDAWFQAWKARGCALLHGVKDYSGHHFVRRTFLPLRGK